MLRGILCAICLSAALGGCIFSPNKGSEKVPPITYEPNRFPEAVLRNLAKAYKQKDSTTYVSLYDTDYQGSSIDQLDPTPQLLSVTWADEATHIGALSRSSVSDIEAELVPILRRFNDGGDPPGWATIQDPFGRMIITDPAVSTEYIVRLDQILHIYKFIPYPGTGTDTTWKIIRWTEVRQ